MIHGRAAGRKSGSKCPAFAEVDRSNFVRMKCLNGKMWLKQCHKLHKPPKFGNGNHTTHKNGDLGGSYDIVLPIGVDLL